MSLKTKDWLGLGLAGAAIGGAYDWGGNNGGGFSTGNYGSNFAGLTDSLGFGGNTSADLDTAWDNRLLSAPDGMTTDQMNKYMAPLEGTDTSWLGGLAEGTSNFLGSNAGKNMMQFGAPIAQGLIGANSASRAADMSAASADKDRQAYLTSLNMDQARIDSDQKKRDEASSAMSAGFSMSGLA